MFHSTPSKLQRIARALLHSHSPEPPPSRSRPCFACGRSFVAGSGRFCSERCRAAFDNGAPRGEELTAPYGANWRVIAGPAPGYLPRMPMRPGRHGFFIACVGCSAQFESSGLRCCSTECERSYRNREDAKATLAEIGEVLPEKRRCECCGAPMAKYVGVGKRRRLANATKRYCSSRCRQKVNKTAVFEGSKPLEPGGGPPRATAPLFAPQPVTADLPGTAALAAL
jgi:hypothetical protein